MPACNYLIPFLTLLAGFLMTFAHPTESSAADKSTKVLRHIVLYKFKDDLRPEQVQEVVDAFAALPGKIDTVAGLEYGTNVSEEGKSEGLTHCFLVTFRDAAGRDAYIQHPAHQEYVNLVRPRREKVVVFDFWVDK
jgi:stress responsive alpha/beta barrel protein